MTDYSLGTKHLSLKTKLSYGLGHILNDSCASMWFTYLLVYLQYVLRLDKGLAGLLLLLGQVVDAVTTPLIGIQSDRGCATSCCHYGRRKTWHAIGTFCVIVSFPFIFILCKTCNCYWPHTYIVLIGLMIILFQFGWAAVQVAHLAMIPDLTPNEEEREELNIIRYFFDVLSDVLVYGIIWLSFTYENANDRSDLIDPSDYDKFQTTTIVIVTIGGIFSLLFHIFTPEAPWALEHSSFSLKASSSGEDDELQGLTMARGTAGPEDLSLRISMTWKDWLTEPQFYYVSLLYSCARLVTNLSNIYMPIFLQETIHAKEDLIAVMPLVMSLSGIVATLLLKWLRKFSNKKASLAIAILIGLFACTISSMEKLPTVGLYAIAILIGLSGSIMLILSLAFIADLIGYCTDSSAFVYGSMSFWEKIINGFAVFLIQELASTSCYGENCAAYYKWVMSLGIMIPLLIGLLGLGVIASMKIGKTRKITEAFRETTGSRGLTPPSSDSSEFLLATDSKMGYSSISRI